MAHKKKSKKPKAKWCVFAGKTKKLSCHTKKSAAKKVAKSRHKRGLKARVKRGKR